MCSFKALERTTTNPVSSKVAANHCQSLGACVLRVGPWVHEEFNTTEPGCRFPPVATCSTAAKQTPCGPVTTIIKDTSVKLLIGQLQLQTSYYSVIT